MNNDTISKPEVVIADHPSKEVEQLVAELQDYHVETMLFTDGTSAYEFCIKKIPNLVITELNLPKLSGSQLFQQLKSNFITKNIPVIITAKESDLEERLKTLELGIEDYILKPYYPEEVAARVDAILQEMDEPIELSNDSGLSFSGTLEEMNLVDLIQTLELGHKSGVVYLSRADDEGCVYINEGEIYDAYLSEQNSEKALLNMITWLQGNFRVILQKIDRKRNINRNNRDLLILGTRLINEYRRLASQIPPLKTIVMAKNGIKSSSLSAEEKYFLQLFSEPLSLNEAVAICEMDDIKALESLKGLFDKGLLTQTNMAYQPRHTMTQKIVSQVEKARSQYQDETAIIASFFTGKGGKDSSKTRMSIDVSGDLETEPPFNKYKSQLNRGDLLLIRQNLT